MDNCILTPVSCSSSHLLKLFSTTYTVMSCCFLSLTFTMPVTLSAYHCTWQLLLSVWLFATHSLCLGAHNSSGWVGGQAEGLIHISSGHSWGLEGQTRKAWTQCHPKEREGTVCLFPSGPKTAQQSSERYRSSSRGYVELDCRDWSHLSTPANTGSLLLQKKRMLYADKDMEHCCFCRSHTVLAYYSLFLVFANCSWSLGMSDLYLVPTVSHQFAFVL